MFKTFYFTIKKGLLLVTNLHVEMDCSLLGEVQLVLWKVVSILEVSSICILISELWSMMNGLVDWNTSNGLMAYNIIWLMVSTILYILVFINQYKKNIVLFEM